MTRAQNFLTILSCRAPQIRPGDRRFLALSVYLRLCHALESNNPTNSSKVQTDLPIAIYGNLDNPQSFSYKHSN